jgi:2-iminoacetate synthase ThiH
MVTKGALEEDNGQEDFYLEDGFVVFTRSYHLKRGYCCNQGCRHCPYKKGTEDKSGTRRENEKPEK